MPSFVLKTLAASRPETEAPKRTTARGGRPAAETGARRRRSSAWEMVSAFEKTLTKQRPGYSGTKEGPGRQVEPRRRKQSIVAFLQKLKAEPEPAPEAASDGARRLSVDGAALPPPAAGQTRFQVVRAAANAARATRAARASEEEAAVGMTDLEC